MTEFETTYCDNDECHAELETGQTGLCEECQVDTETSIKVSLFISVHDQEAFRQRAYSQALSEDLSEEDANVYLDKNLTSLGDCAIMIFDPGVSPNGCDIVESTAEVS